MFDYYKAWDKFADEAEKEADSEIIPATNPAPQKMKEPTTQAEMLQRTSGAQPNTKIVIKGGSVKKSSSADHLKQ